MRQFGERNSLFLIADGGDQVAGMQYGIRMRVRVYLAVAAAAAAFLAARKLGFWHVPVREAFYIVIGPSFALLLYAFDWLRHVRPLMVLGGVSYEIYLVHGVVLNNLLRFGWPPVILVVVVVPVTIILAVFLNIALRRRRKI